VKVLFATSEATPLVKTGGLADVSAALPAALRRAGVDARVLMPGYGPVLGWVEGRARLAGVLELPPFPVARLLESALPGGTPLLVLDCPALYAREGGPYHQPGGAEWPDNDFRFGLLSRAAAELARPGRDWVPQVLHCNDWQTGLAPSWLSILPGPRAATLMTIHNLAYQGLFPATAMERLGLPWSLFQPDGVEFHGNLSFLKAGLFHADRLSTVSPTYAREIQQAPLGFGMQGLLSWRSRYLSGVLNGIDTAAWNPGTDPLIARRYGPGTLARKDDNRAALRERFGLSPGPGRPLFGVVSRFAHQKGLDLLAEVTSQLVALPAQLAVLGSGEAPLEAAFRELATRHPGEVGVVVGFDEGLSHLLEAGADVFVMPSRYEPSGLNQMYSQRYGTPVVARDTGGLADTVTDCAPATLAEGTATGFLFREPTPEALLEALTRAAAAFANRRMWRALQRNGMARDFSWDASAARYAALYADMTASPGGWQNAGPGA
jgi:starch synthase